MCWCFLLGQCNPAPCSPAGRGRVRVCQPWLCSLFCCSASYKNKENIDLSKVPTYARASNDTGSPEYQVATLTARIEQISKHLANNRKDHAAKRGLVAILNQRKSLLQYLYRKDR